MTGGGPSHILFYERLQPLDHAGAVLVAQLVRQHVLVALHAQVILVSGQEGMRHQIRTYQIEDKDLTQDIVAAMMVFAYLTRFLSNTLPSQGKQVIIRTPAKTHRIARSRRTTRRR